MKHPLQDFFIVSNRTELCIFYSPLTGLFFINLIALKSLHSFSNAYWKLFLKLFIFFLGKSITSSTCQHNEYNIWVIKTNFLKLYLIKYSTHLITEL